MPRLDASSTGRATSDEALPLLWTLLRMLLGVVQMTGALSSLHLLARLGLTKLSIGSAAATTGATLLSRFTPAPVVGRQTATRPVDIDNHLYDG